MKPSKSRSCSSQHLSEIVVWYTATGCYISLHTELTSQTRRDPPCADSPDQDSGFKRLILYEFTLWGRDVVPVVRIRERPYYRGFPVRNREVSVPRGSTVLRGYMTTNNEIASRQNL